MNENESQPPPSMHITTHQSLGDWNRTARLSEVKQRVKRRLLERLEKAKKKKAVIEGQLRLIEEQYRIRLRTLHVRVVE